MRRAVYVLATSPAAALALALPSPAASGSVGDAVGLLGHVLILVGALFGLLLGGGGRGERGRRRDRRRRQLKRERLERRAAAVRGPW